MNHAGMPAEPDEMKKAAFELGKWLSGALEDSTACQEFKDAINAWFDTGMPAPDQESERERALAGALHLLHDAVVFSRAGVPDEDAMDRALDATRAALTMEAKA